MKRCVVVALLVVWTAPPARAELVVASSLEWLTCRAQVVVVGKVEKVTVTRGPGDVRYHDCTVRVSDTIKGRQVAQLVFCLRTLSADSPAQGWQKAKKDVLLFLSPSTGHGPEKRLEKMLVPANDQTPLSVMDLETPAERVFDRHFKRITERRAILEVVRFAAKEQAAYRKAKPKAPVQSVSLDSPFDSDVFRALWGGSAVLLKVPDFLAPPNPRRGIR